MLLSAIVIFLWVFVAFALIRIKLPMLNTLLAASISFILANSLLSMAYVLLFFIHIPFTVSVLVLLAIPLMNLIFFRKHIEPLFKLKNHNLLSAASLFLLLLLLYRFSSNFLEQSSIWGAWDAWAIWSLHAKFLLHDMDLGLLFTGVIEATHPDYPLMLPGLIALYWKLLGEINPFVPLFIAYGISLSLLLVCFSSFLQNKRTALGLIVLLTLISEHILLPFGAMQYADTLLALFYLLSFLFYQLNKVHEEKLITLLIGFCAASCGWIKNEGLMFFLIFSLLFLIVSINKKKKIFYYLLGASIPLMIILYFKIHFDASSDLLSKKNNDIAEKLLDLNRYKVIWKFTCDYLAKNNQIICYSLIAALFLNQRYFKSFSFFVLVIVFVGYFLIYVITPVDLNWHLSTSFDRLIHQIAPSIIFTIGSGIGQKQKGFFNKNTEPITSTSP